MNINDLFVIREEDNNDYIYHYDSSIKITSYAYKRNKDWKKTVDFCGNFLYQEIRNKYSSLKILFWVQVKFNKEPTKIEKYKGIQNDKNLFFLKNKILTYKFFHDIDGKYGFSAFLEINDEETFSATLNYLRDNTEGVIFLASNISDFKEFDNEIYMGYTNFPSLVNLLINKNCFILRPYGSFDDREFYLEIYEKLNFI